jgi:hypothetical protein
MSTLFPDSDAPLAELRARAEDVIPGGLAELRRDIASTWKEAATAAPIDCSGVREMMGFLVGVALSQRRQGQSELATIYRAMGLELTRAHRATCAACGAGEARA